MASRLVGSFDSQQIFETLFCKIFRTMEWPVLLILAFISLVQSKGIRMSCRKIRAFVDGHNSRRFLIAEGKLQGQPAASEMTSVVWDEELHEKATKWASKYERHRDPQRHNPNKSIPSGRFVTGENIYWYSTTDLQYKLRVDQALDAWFNEYKNFTFGPMEMDHFAYGQNIGHYTQMVWSDSVYIGCAISRKRRHDWHHYFVVCNYGPQGNYIGQTPYKTDGRPSRNLICDHEQCNRPYGNKC